MLLDPPPGSATPSRPTAADPLAPYTAIDPHSLGDAAILDGIEELLELHHRLDAVLAGYIQAADVKDSTATEAGKCTRSWLVEEQRLSPDDATRRLTVARGVTRHPATGEALRNGDISHEHARRIVGCLRRLPQEWVEPAEQILLEASMSLDPTTLGRVAAKLRLESGADDSREEAEQRRYASRWATLASTFDGMTRLEAMLDPESAATLQTALVPLMKKVSADDDRTAGQRRADALVELAQHRLASPDMPQVNGAVARLGVLIDFDSLRAEVAGTLGEGALQSNGLPLSAAAVRRLACDAEIYPVVLGGDSEVLDLGRSHRGWSRAQREAAAIRDGGCAWPGGCSAGLDRCRLHHLDFWIHGGRTDIANSAHLCLFHHWLVHHGNWCLWRDDTGRLRVRRT